MKISFSRPPPQVDCYEFVEVEIRVAPPASANPFTDVTVSGEFTRAGGAPMRTDGFCDADDGSVFRIRFMPSQPGRHAYSIEIQGTGLNARHRGTFTARVSDRKGPVRVDKEHPWHFIREGTGEHYFWNSTTTYWLLGWRDDTIIRQGLDRLGSLKVNRIRVALNGRTHDGMRWKEPEVKSTNKFQFRLEPWRAARPNDIENPGYDVTRFNLEHFRKAERMLVHARERDIVVSLIFHLDGRDKGVDPFGHAGMGGPNEQRYYRYVIARLGAFANVMWDVTNEWHLFRNEPWVEQMGAFIKECDPYKHLTSVHGRGDFPFRASPWCDFAMYQSWDEHGGYAFMLKNRQDQAKTGRPMPQVNEEYGYEDHYPSPWGESRTWPARAAGNRRRLAWEITMAGCYQTTGERANVPGMGGWITGRGNEEMTMLKGYAYIGEFLDRMQWWELEPRPDLVSGGGALCLADIDTAHDATFVIYLPAGGSTRVTLGDGKYAPRLFDPRTGEAKDFSTVAGGPGDNLWNTPATPDDQDWVWLVRSIR